MASVYLRRNPPVFCRACAGTAGQAAEQLLWASRLQMAGLLKAGPHAGKVGILIGETGDLRQRVKQYVSGTQESGNKLWRQHFLSLGDIRLYTLDLQMFKVSDGGTTSIPVAEALASNNMRLVLEQLLVRQAVADSGNSTWVVNARQ